MSNRFFYPVFAFIFFVVACPKNSQDLSDGRDGSRRQRDELNEQHRKNQEVFDNAVEDIAEFHSVDDFKNEMKNIDSIKLTEHQKRNLKNMNLRHWESKVCLSLDEWAADCVPNCPETERCDSNNANTWFPMLRTVINDFEGFGRMPDCLENGFNWSDSYFKDCPQNKQLKDLADHLVLGKDRK